MFYVFFSLKTYPKRVILNTFCIVLICHLQVEALSSPSYGLLYSNVILSGGCVSIPGFVDRFNKELRSIVPQDLDVHVSIPGDPQGCALAGGYAYAQSSNYDALKFSRAEYMEHGSDRIGRLLPEIISNVL